MKTLRTFISESLTKQKNLILNETLSFKMDPPNIILLKRKAIRIFPDGRKVALYHADKIDKYISIPYSDMDDKNILQVEEEEAEKKADRRGNMPTLENIVQSNQEGTLTFEDSTDMDVDVMTAKAILALYSKVNPVNQHKIEHMVNVDKNNFAKVAAFAHGAHSLGK
jgi:hypothetical protein